MIDYEYYYEQYRHVPNTSVTEQERDLVDYRSTIFSSIYNIWSASIKRPITTTYINGNTLLNLHESPHSTNSLFPKGKCRRKPFTPCEKKINTGDVSISLMPIEKTRSSLSSLPDAQRKSADNRINSANTLNNRNNEGKSYERCATTHANGAWVRRYKSINQSQTLTALLRGQPLQNQVLLRKRTCQKLSPLSSTSTSSVASSINKCRRAKY